MTDRLRQFINEVPVEGLDVTTPGGKDAERTIRESLIEQVMDTRNSTELLTFEERLSGIEFYDKCRRTITSYTRKDGETEFTLSAEFDAEKKETIITMEQGVEYPQEIRGRITVVVPLVLTPTAK